MIRRPLAATLLAVALTACGEDSTGAPAASTTAAQTGAETIERKGPIRGTLIVRPASVEAGRTIRIAVDNRGARTLYFGLGNRVQRHGDDGWEDVTEEVFGTKRPAVRRVLLSAPPGERAGPDHGGVVDRIRLPDDLAPGRYRVVKRVSANERTYGPPQARLDGRFRVR
jgi:hypothetical protein